MFKNLTGWSARRKAWAVFASGCVATTSYILWMAFGPPPKMPISKETTHFLAPIDEESGLLNTYAAVWKAKGWPTEKLQHPWHGLRRHDPGAKDLQYKHPADVLAFDSHADWERFKRNERQPFDDDDDPEYAALIDENEPWFQAMLDSEPAADSPVWSQLTSLPRQAFRLRAMLAFGRGDTKRGVQSLRFIARLADGQRQWMGCMSDFSAAARCDADCSQATVALLFALTPPPDELCQFAFEFCQPRSLNRLAATVIDEGERYHDLAYLSQPVAYRGFNSLWNNEEQSMLSEKGIRTNWFLHRIDWNRFATTWHKFVDEFVERLRIDDDFERTCAIEEYRDAFLAKYETGQPDRNDWFDVLTADLTRVAEVKAAHRFYRVENSINFNNRTRQQVCLAVYLARFRQEHGRFPKSLDELAPQIPAKHRYILQVSATRRDWAYEVQDRGNGFVLKPQETQRAAMQWPSVQLDLGSETRERR